MTTAMDEAVRIYGKPTMTGEQLAQWEKDVRSGALRAVLRVGEKRPTRSFSVSVPKPARTVPLPPVSFDDSTESIIAAAKRRTDAAAGVR